MNYYYSQYFLFISIFMYVGIDQHTCCFISAGACLDTLKYLFVSESYIKPGISFGFVSVVVVEVLEVEFVLVLVFV